MLPKKETILQFPDALEHNKFESRRRCSGIYLFTP